MLILYSNLRFGLHTGLGHENCPILYKLFVSLSLLKFSTFLVSLKIPAVYKSIYRLKLYCKFNILHFKTGTCMQLTLR